MSKPKATYRTMTESECTAARALGQCHLRHGFDKPFIESRCLQIQPRMNRVITDRQANVLWMLVYRYRRQIPEFFNDLRAQVGVALARKAMQQAPSDYKPVQKYDEFGQLTFPRGWAKAA